MKRVQMILIFFLVMLSTAAWCANIGNVRFPKPSEEFQRNKIFNVSSTEMFRKVETVLENNRIGIDIQDKSSGKIVSDYIQGESHMYALGFLGTIQMRYKYSIKIKPVNDNVSNVDIICRLESSGNKMTAWREITNDNMELVTKLEDWLYENITQAQPVEKKSEPSAVSQNITSSYGSMIVNESKVKLRTKPSANATVIKTMQKGEEVQIVKQKDEWCLIELIGGETGWCLKGALVNK
jgi:uncharacterized protein YgiM (DUF1202 family)